MQLVLRRFVLPRHLTERQKVEIAKYLRRYEPKSFRIGVAVNNSEADGYRVDIEDALVRGGWQAIGPAPVRNNSGLVTFLQETDEHARIRDPARPKADEILRDAFASVGVRLDGNGRSSGPNVTDESLAINIGNRRMDDAEESDLAEARAILQKYGQQ
jgi:hypothetical protein